MGWLVASMVSGVWAFLEEVAAGREPPGWAVDSAGSARGCEREMKQEPAQTALKTIVGLLR